MSRAALSVQSVLKLLRSGDAEEVAAAALVLARTHPQSPAVLRALRLALARAAVGTRPYLLDALAAQRSSAATDLLLDQLHTMGAVRDHATDLLAQRRGVLPALQRWCVQQPEGSDLGAAIAVLERHAGTAAARALLALLPQADFLTARRVYGAMARIAEHSSVTRQRELGALTLKAWKRVGAHDTGRIAVLKILTALRSSAGRPLIPEALQAVNHPAVRRGALALAAVLPLRRGDRALRGLLLNCALSTEESVNLRAEALQALLACGAADALAVHFAALLDGPAPVACAAVELLPRMTAEQSAPHLSRALQHRDARVCAAAGRVLAAHPQLLSSATRAGISADQIQSALAAGGDTAVPAAFESLVALLPQTAVPEPAALTALAACDKERADALCCARADEALRRGACEDAVAWLEPLVRGRFASPTGRALLAIAWTRLRALPGNSGSATPRCLQLLGPLIRLSGFDPVPLLRDAALLPREDCSALADLLNARGRPERALAARLSEA